MRVYHLIKKLGLLIFFKSKIKEGKMKKMVLGFCLIIVFLAAIVNYVPAKAPSCDQYLSWCVFSYCQQYYNPDQYLNCVNACAANYVDNCM